MRISCTICRELFLPAHVVLVTNCGHLYHKDCISQWAAKQHSCPQCRAKLVFQPIRVFFNLEDDLNNSNDADTLEIKFAELSDKHVELTIQHQVISQKLISLKDENQDLKQKEESIVNNYHLQLITISSLKEELKSCNSQIKSFKKTEKDYNKVLEELTLLKSVDTILKGSESEVEMALANTPCTPQALRQLLTYVEALKQQSVKNSDRYKKLLQSQKPLLDELHSVKRQNESLKARIDEQDFQLQNAKCQPSRTPSKPAHDITNLSHLISDPSIRVIDKCQVRKESSQVFQRSKMMPSKRLMSTSSTKTTSSSGYSFDGMGGSKRISLANPTPAEELIVLRVKKNALTKQKSLKPIERKNTHMANVPDIMDISTHDCGYIELD